MYTAAALHPTRNQPQQALVKTDMMTGQAWLWCKHDRYYAGEPAFVPKQRLLPSQRQQQQQQQQQQRQQQQQDTKCQHAQQAQQGGTHWCGQPHEYCAQSDASAQAQHTACSDTNAGVAEDDGWILALCYDAAAHSSELVVLDARNIEVGPIAILLLRKTIPHGLHGNWSDVYFGPGV